MILRDIVSIQSIVSDALSSGVSHWGKMEALDRSCCSRTFNVKIYSAVKEYDNIKE
jgi:hypothetical protein